MGRDPRLPVARVAGFHAQARAEVVDRLLRAVPAGMDRAADDVREENAR